MNLSIDRWIPSAAPARRMLKVRKTDVQDHDLPVLATAENPPAVIDWEPLLAAGVHPALILGAERRWQGRR
ncbi:MAG TPA: hypothetical protein VFP44_02040 [Usitatibacter sp.]|nr:hypothetical protein [Usitatibacter sp.]